MSQPSIKQYKINSSPLHSRKLPSNNPQYIMNRNGLNSDPFQSNMNLLHNNNQIIFPKKTPTFNLSKSQDSLPKNFKKPDFISTEKQASKTGSNTNDFLSKNPKESQFLGGNPLKKNPQVALKLPKIGTPSYEEKKGRSKANSVPTKPKDKKEKGNEKEESTSYQVQVIDIKKQKRLSDAGNIGFILTGDNAEEYKKSHEKQIIKPHAASYSESV